MALQKPDEKITIDKVLQLALQLTPEEQDQLIDELKIRWLKREIQIGIDQADRGELIDGDVVFAKLLKRHQDD
jgi:hypothetical protein